MFSFMRFHSKSKREREREREHLEFYCKRTDDANGYCVGILALLNEANLLDDDHDYDDD